MKPTHIDIEARLILQVALSVSLIGLWLMGCVPTPASQSAATLRPTLPPAPITNLIPTAKISSSTPTAPTTLNKRGVHLLLADALHDWPVEIWSDHLGYARQAVGEQGYVLQLVRLDDMDVSRWQHFMDLCAELQLRPIIRLATQQMPDAGYWDAPPADPDGSYRIVAARYAEFIAALTWPTQDHYVIVGNEPNHGSEWGGIPDPAAYARFLLDVSHALHAADSQARVLNAGFDPYTPHTNGQPFIDGQIYIDAESFMDQMIAAQPDVFSHIDVWASHAYPLGPFIAPPWEQTFQIDLTNDATNPGHLDPPPNMVNRGVNGYEWELHKLDSYGVLPLSVMITETGWRHAESADLTSPDNGRPLPDAALASQYLDLALRGNQGRYPDLAQTGWKPWQSDPRVIAVIPFALNGLPSFWGHTNWLVLDGSGEVSGLYPLVDAWAGLAD